MVKIMLFLFIFISFGISAQTNYKVEDKLYKCLVNEYKNNNIDLDKELLVFENYLIDNKILKSKSGESYVELYNALTSTTLEFYIVPNEFDNLNKIGVDELNKSAVVCFSEIDSNSLKKSQFYKAQYATFEYRKHQGFSEFNSVFEAYNSVIKAKDYQHKYYKSKVLFAAYYVGDVEAGLPQTISVDLPSNPEENNCIDCKILEIKLDSLNRFTINNKLKNNSEIELIIKDFIIKNAPKYKVVLTANKNASYQAVINIIAYSKKITSELASQKSLEIYNKSYNNLSDDLKLKIDKYYPQPIKLKYAK